MRVEPIPPADLTEPQRDLDARIRAFTGRLSGFISERPDGALLGPFPPMLHFPQFGDAAWGLTEALTQHTTLSKPVHEIAILVTGARFHSRYELYAHEHVAAQAGLSPAKIATLVAGERPPDLTPEEAAAHDVGAVLAKGGQLPEATYRAALAAFGEDGVAELVFLVGNYAFISVLLNAYDVGIPGQG